MQPCAKLLTIFQSLYNSASSGNLVNVARQLYSSQPGVRIIGSDPKDWYLDYESLIRVYEKARTEVVEIKPLEINACCESSVGGVIDRVIARLPEGKEVLIRHTYVFHQEDNIWEIVHAHMSVGIPDEMIGN